jgi:hypothetical protein
MSYLDSSRPQEDRRQGEEAESLFMRFLEKKGRHPTREHGSNFPDFDISDEQFTYEVKLDRKVQETGNVYIEHKSLFNSKSDYFVYLYELPNVPGRFFIHIAPSAKVRNLYRRVQGQRGIVGGDFKEPGILLTVEEFIQVFRPIGWTLQNQSE